MTLSKSRTIAVVGGGWSTNVGNGFFNLGTLEVLKQVFPEDRIVLLCDQESNWDFRNRQTPKNSLRFLDHIAPDYIVLHGCIFNSYLPQMWSETFRRLTAKGTRILFLSTGLMHYSDEEIAKCREFLQDNPPFLFVSRDAVTYGKFNDLAEFAYDGIDTGFFVPEAFPPIKLDLPPYVACTFDKLPEPTLRLGQKGASEIVSDNNDAFGLMQRTDFEFAGQPWILEFPLARYKLSNLLGKFYPYVEAVLLSGRKYSSEVGSFKIVRMDHQSNPWFVKKMYRAPNSFAWDLPEPYLAIYANAALTLSDRVHACVASLAYGKPAMLFSRSPRSLILDRVGVTEIRNRAVKISQSRLYREKEQMVDFLRGIPFP